MRRRCWAISLGLILLSPIVAPSAVGEWGTDTWLTNIIGPERLEHGDEFGCHGFEGVDTIEENWVISGCRDYLAGLTDASKWGRAPVSFGIEADSLDQNTVDSLIDSGFIIVGDSSEEYPEELVSMARNGGSLEKGVADIGLLDSAEEDSLVSIHWRARIGDFRVRDDADVISWLEEQQVWFTTWGEWHFHGISGRSTTVIPDGTVVTSTSPPSERWNVPGTIMLQFDQDVKSVYDSNGAEVPLIPLDSRDLTIGWRPIETGMLLTQSPGTNITIELDGSVDAIETIPMSTFNGLHHGVTIVGHHTSNLFRWTQDFPESVLSFTWLVERPAKEGISWIIPAFAVSMIIAVPVSIYFLVKNDGSIISIDQEE
tara:strand:+ start:3327 stop:4439 length:1113 start_codon:yes stop_codon:yes gene_type:complete